MVWVSLRAPQVAVLVVALAAAMLAALEVRSLRLRSAAAALLVACLVWHAAALLLYWQMLPAYLASFLLLGFALFGSRPRKRVVAGGAAILVLCSTASLIVLPLFRLPAPTGAFAVGTTILHLVDPARPDPAFRSGHREWMVQVWYPSDAGRDQHLAPYRRWQETTALSSYQAVLPTHSLLYAAVTAGRFPLLLFNPAWEGQRTQNTFLAEDLASHGFVVAAIDHTHNSAPVAFPDGTVVRASEPRGVDDFSGVTMDQVLSFANQEIATEAEDDLQTLDAFAGWVQQPSSIWYQHVDTDHTGALGHSFGGAVAVAACARDPRIRAVLNMDGWMFGALGKSLGKPLFVMDNEDWPFDAANVARERHSSSMSDRLDIADLDGMLASFHASGGYLLAIEGIRHMDFTDRSLYSPVRRLTGSGQRSAGEVQAMIRAYALAFFSNQLRGTQEPLLTPGAHFPDTHFESW